MSRGVPLVLSRSCLEEYLYVQVQAEGRGYPSRPGCTPDRTGVHPLQPPPPQCTAVRAEGLRYSGVSYSTFIILSRVYCCCFVHCELILVQKVHAQSRFSRFMPLQLHFFCYFWVEFSVSSCHCDIKHFCLKVQFYNVLMFDSEVFCWKLQLCTMFWYLTAKFSAWRCSYVQCFDIWQRSFLLEGATGYSCSRVEGRTGSGTGEGDGGWIQDAAVLVLVPRPLLLWVGLAPVLRLWSSGFQW